MKFIDDLISFSKSVTWKYITWITKPINQVMKAGFFLCILGFGGAGWAALDVEHSSADGTHTSVSLEVSQSKPFWEPLMTCVGLIGLAMVIGESLYIICRRRKVLNIAIEHIALRERISSPLINFVSKESGGSESLSIDLTKCYRSLVVNDPQEALNVTVINLRNTFMAKKDQTGIKDITVHYGGTAPVGLGFLAGFILGNTSHVITWDYNRDSGEWYKLAGYSDTNKPFIDWSSYQPAKEICIIMEISHPVSTGDVRKKISDLSYVKVSMPEIKYDNMASKEKMDAFQLDFREMMKKLNADGVELVHIFCAAQAAFNFCMGRQITKNHPACIVYEYQNSLKEKYPWGVLFNTKDEQSPAIIQGDKATIV
ncbi:SMODS-associated and fused to various effectors domain-containing protein [Candidatus Electrothrix laxa]